VLTVQRAVVLDAHGPWRPRPESRLWCRVLTTR
jgi:hypothetical protein